MQNIYTADLYGVFGYSNTEVYAVGDKTVLAYDGVEWKESDSLQTLNLRAIWGTPSGHLWAVGEEGALRNRTPAGSWDSVPYTLEKWSDLNGIWGVSEPDIYAVGTNGTIIKYHEHRWEAQDVPVSSDLQAIWGTTASDIYAVGLDGVVLHFDGEKWTEIDVGSGSYFYGVWGASSADLYVVGHGVLQEKESAFHYDGQKWTDISPPEIVRMDAIWGLSPNDLFTVAGSEIYRFVGDPL
jgi:hypothetical protein